MNHGESSDRYMMTSCLHSLLFSPDLVQSQDSIFSVTEEGFLRFQAGHPSKAAQFLLVEVMHITNTPASSAPV